jgi:hypothetical protein
MNAIVKVLCAGAACAALLAAAVAPASAAVIEVGSTTESQATPSCPSPCIAISRTTGYQTKVGAIRGAYRVPANGRIVAWTIALGAPGPEQVQFFDNGFGGPASAGIAVIKKGKKRAAKVMNVSSIRPLAPFFGQVVQFPLARGMYVKRGWVVALTVPTWAPALSVGLPADHTWRASRLSRPEDQCLDTETQTAQRRKLVDTVFGCAYETARLTYTATLVTTPTAPVPPTEGT